MFNLHLLIFVKKNFKKPKTIIYVRDNLIYNMNFIVKINNN